MNFVSFMYHWNNLKELDPDQLVTDLELTTEDILERFSHEAEEFIKREFDE